MLMEDRDVSKWEGIGICLEIVIVGGIGKLCLELVR